MVEISISYEGELHCKALHGPSGSTLETDAPRDNMGKGESFSPTDLVATALGSCMLTVMDIAARKMKLDLKGASAHVKKEMAAAPARQISRLTVDIHVPASISEEHKEKLIAAAMSCPVHKSLNPEIEMPITFTWG